MKFTRGVAAVATTAVLVLTACTSQESSDSPERWRRADADDTLTIGARVDNNSFDPADLEIGNRVQYWQPVYDTLLRLDADAEPQPNLATEWAYNEDNTVLTLQLRDDVTFTDGESFDGDAVKANIEHIKAGTGQNQFMVAGHRGGRGQLPDRGRAAALLAGPLAALLPRVGGRRDGLARQRSESDSIASEPVGSGPYVFDADASTPAPATSTRATRTTGTPTTTRTTPSRFVR